jgi:TRAP-type uncharacterized transport system substrate-binding protein
MIGFPAKPRVLAMLVAALFLAAAAGLLVAYIWKPHATLRITIGPEGTQAHKFISAFIKVTEAQHPRIKFETVVTPTLLDSAKALEQGKVDIAVIRSDVPLPVNGETLVILRHDALAIILPHKSGVSGVPDLVGKTVGFLASPAQNDNARAFDMLLSFYNIAPEKVKREFIDIADIGTAVESKKIAAVFAVGPSGPGEVVQAVAAIAKATKNTPKILNFDDADAIVKRYPVMESFDAPKGSFLSRPSVPDDDVTTPGVNYRFAVPITMLDIVADAIGRSVLTTKAQLMTVAPMAAQIEAPDVSDQNPLLPIHPGFAAYLNNGDQSFFDQAERYLYIFGIPLSVGASVLTLVVGMFTARSSKKDREALERMLIIADEAKTADKERLEALESELHQAIAECVAKTGEDADKSDHWRTQLAVQHAMRRFERRDAALKSGGGAPADEGRPVSPANSP